MLSFKYRIKDATTGKHLARHAYASNQVWNFCVATQREADRRRKAGLNVSWPSAYDLIRLCTGSGALLGLHSDTVSAICRRFAIARDVGNVSAARLAKTRMAKSVLDAGWSMFRTQVAYKARRHNAVFREANERGTTVTCSSCGARSGPEGQKGLRIRRWQCSCGAEHDRDLNSALNILRVGLECQAPVEEIAA